MKMDLDIDLVINSYKGKKTFIITLLRDKESQQRGQHPYLAQRLELFPELPLLSMSSRTKYGSPSVDVHAKGGPPHIEGSGLERTRSSLAPIIGGSMIVSSPSRILPTILPGGTEQLASLA
jgi:hypothetical protein